MFTKHIKQHIINHIQILTSLCILFLCQQPSYATTPTSWRIYESSFNEVYCIEERPNSYNDHHSTLSLSAHGKRTILSASKYQKSVIWSDHEVFAVAENSGFNTHFTLYKVIDNIPVKNKLHVKPGEIKMEDTVKLSRRNSEYELTNCSCEDGGRALGPTYSYKDESTSSVLRQYYDECSGFADRVVLRSHETAVDLFKSTYHCFAIMSPDRKYIAVEDILDHHLKNIHVFSVSLGDLPEFENVCSFCGRFDIENELVGWRQNATGLALDLTRQVDGKKTTVTMEFIDD